MQLLRFTVDATRDDGETQRVEGRGLAGERFTGDFALRRLQQAGLPATPLPGAVGIGAFLEGDRRRGYQIGVESGDKRARNVAPGYQTIYGANGEAVSIVENNIRLVAAKISIVGDLEITGGSVKHKGVNIGDTHIHPESIGTVTGPPQ